MSTELLDQLDAAHEKAAPGEWEHLAGEGVWVADEALGFGTFVTQDVDEETAALIVAAVNALPKLTAALRAVLAKHTPVEWFEEVEPGDEVFDPNKPLPPFCHECTDDEYVDDVEMGYRIDQGSPVVYWPCATVEAITDALTSEAVQA